MTTQLYSRKDVIGWVLSEWRARAVHPYVTGSFLDLACGDNRLVRRHRSGVGVDIVGYRGVDVLCRDFSRLPFRDRHFDTVTIVAALNYFDDPVSVLREVRRVLKPDGTLLVTFLNKTLSTLWHKVRERKITPRPSFDEAELTTCLQAANLRIVSKKSFMLGLKTIYFIKNS
jgi:SAM-dependent methyltransferase